jgi:Thioesterase-like superfamily
MPEPFFHVDSDDFLPTRLCQGPWDPGHAHGGPPSALLVRVIERHEPDPTLTLGRVLLDLVRPVPLAPLRISTVTTRPGRRVQIVEATMTTADGTELVRARALRIRRVPAEVAPQAPAVEPLPFAGPDGPAAAAVVGDADAPRVGIMLGVDVRPVTGSFLVPGPATAWFRLLAPLIDDEEPTPMQRATVAADFGNGISQVLGPEFVFINPDLVVHFEREPVGEWIALAATTRMTAGAGALASGVLYDTTGRIGQSEQSLYVGPRTAA